MSENVKIRYSNSRKPFAESSAKLYKTKAKVELHDRERVVSLVTKRFESEHDAQNASETYNRLWEMGIRLLPITYRLKKEGSKEIVMTDLTKGGNVAVSSNHDLDTEVGKITSIDLHAFENSLSSLREMIVVAARNQVDIPEFAYFAILPQAGGENIATSFMIGDLDHIQFDSSEDFRYLLHANMFTARQFLNDCILSRVSDSNNREQLEKAILRWSEAIRLIGRAEKT